MMKFVAVIKALYFTENENTHKMQNRDSSLNTIFLLLF